MTTVLSRILVSGLTLLVACPPGWCCAGLFADNETGRATERQPTRPLAKGNCCCPHAPIPAKAPQAPRRTPASPAEKAFCCCPADRILSPAIEKPTIDHAVAFVLVDLASCPELALTGLARETAATGLSPPLHVVHCVWHC
jgi:hypothetical protein